MTPKTQIQEERMRRYFIDAAKSILRGEGLRGISVRNIAAESGYSYATIYNYYSDVKALIFDCVSEFQDECRQYVENECTKSSDTETQLLSKLMAYSHYFVQHPGIFELFYIEKPNDISGKKSTLELIITFPAQLCQAEWQALSEMHGWTPELLSQKQDELHSIIAGHLLLLNNRHYPADYQLFNSRLLKLMRAIIS
jgi:AcrR family transcriptional regulator